MVALDDSATHPASNRLSGSDIGSAGRGPTFQCVLDGKLVSTNFLGLSTAPICKAVREEMQFQSPPTDPILGTA